MRWRPNKTYNGPEVSDLQGSRLTFVWQEVNES